MAELSQTVSVNYRFWALEVERYRKFAEAYAAELPENPNAFIEHVSTIVLDFDALFMPLKIVVGESNLFTDEVLAYFGHHGGDPETAGWLPVAIVRAAVGGLTSLLSRDEGRLLLVSGTAPWGRLVIQPRGEQCLLEVRSEEHHAKIPNALFATAVAPYDALLSQWRQFAEQMRSDVLGILPELIHHEYYGPWFAHGEQALPLIWHGDDDDDDEEN